MKHVGLLLMLVPERSVRMSPQPNRRQSKKLRLHKTIQSVAFYSAYCVFGGVGFTSSLICSVLSVFLHGQKVHQLGQKLIHRLFGFFVWYVRFFNLVEVDTDELAKVRDCSGVVFVANHPSLLDVVIVIAQMPRMICLMKSSLVSNVVLSGQSRLAGYVVSSSAAGLIHSCRESLRGGGNLLVFPEGTRSRSVEPGPFKMGFALIAKASQAPVQTLIISVSENYLGKGWPFYKQPTLPIRCSVRLGERFELGENEGTRSFGQKIEAYYQGLLQRPNSDSCRA